MMLVLVLVLVVALVLVPGLEPAEAQAPELVKARAASAEESAVRPAPSERASAKESLPAAPGEFSAAASARSLEFAAIRR
jgi:hypothetical protein